MGRNKKEVDTDKVLEMRYDCYSFQEIGRILDMSPTTITEALKEKGITVKSYPVNKKLQGKTSEIVELYKKGNTINSIANLFKVSDYSINKLLVANGFSNFSNRASKTHGLSKHPMYPVWAAMNNRCNNPKDTDYKSYGAKGVYVCERWHKYNPDGLKNFVDDMYPTWKKGLTLDKDKLAKPGVVKCYSPETCCWLTISEQHLYTERFIDNTLKREIARKYKQARKSIIDELSQEYGVSRQTVYKCSKLVEI